MDLTTRCPHCGTVFQASLSDLQLRKGFIRCVQCAHIFDGYAEVVQDTGSVAPAAPAAPRADDAGDTDVVPIWEPGPPQVIRSGHPQGIPPWPADRPDRADRADRPDRAAAPHVRRDFRNPPAGRAPASEPVIVWRDEPPAQPADEAIVVEPYGPYRRNAGTAAPLLQDESLPPGLWERTARFFGWLALGALVLLFAAQLVYVYRAQIAQAVPQVRPWLEQACASLRCQVPYARDISRIVITGSALKVANAAPGPEGAAAGEAPVAAQAAAGKQAPAAQQHFVLQVTLRNQLDQPQEWPTMILDLKDGSGTLLVRRHLAPVDYLGAAAARRPFAARSEASVSVPLAISGVRINGYQLNLFYP